MLDQGILPLYTRKVGGTSVFGMLGCGILPLYMRPVGGTSGCWRAGWKNITFIYETGGRDFRLLACMVEEYYLYTYIRLVGGTSGCCVLG
jgi:hypothetical protein